MSSKRKKKSYNFLLLILLLIVLFATNPNEIKLKQHIKEDFKQEMSESNDVSGALAELVASPAAWLAGLSIERQNYYFFSVYEITLVDGERSYLGILNNFVEIPD